MNDYLKHICIESTEMIIGDVNVNTLSNTIDSEDYLNCLSEFGFQFYINEYTKS